MFRLLFSIFSLLVFRIGLEELALENLALRQQLAVMKRQCLRPGCEPLTAGFGSSSRESGRNGESLCFFLVRPKAVISWRRRGFRLFGSWICGRKRSGRPGMSRELRDLVCKMVEANALWGAPRIHGELLKLGIDTSERTVWVAPG
jgi:putative transposase